jgi:hypothetical protein
MACSLDALDRVLGDACLDGGTLHYRRAPLALGTVSMEKLFGCYP